MLMITETRGGLPPCIWFAQDKEEFIRLVSSLRGCWWKTKTKAEWLTDVGLKNLVSDYVGELCSASGYLEGFSDQQRITVHFDPEHGLATPCGTFGIAEEIEKQFQDCKWYLSKNVKVDIIHCGALMLGIATLFCYLQKVLSGALDGMTIVSKTNEPMKE